MSESFGAFLRERRVAGGMSLRQFAKLCGLQPSNYCNVENSAAAPPPADKVEAIANALGIVEGSEDYTMLLDLAAQGRNEVPADVARIVREREAIPALLRTVENEKVTEEQLMGIIDDLQNGRY